MRDDGYAFEERDDPRTWGEGITPDCERVSDIATKDLYLGEREKLFNALNDIAKECYRTAARGYANEILSFLEACGKLSYFFNMVKSIEGGVNIAMIVATAYQHDLKYYKEMVCSSCGEAYKFYIMLRWHYGYMCSPYLWNPMSSENIRKRYFWHISDEETRNDLLDFIIATKYGYTLPKKRSFIYDFVLQRERREAYRNYLQVCMKNGSELSLTEMEVKYQQKINKRLKKQSKPRA